MLHNPDVLAIDNSDILENLGPKADSSEDVHLLVGVVVKGKLCGCAGCRGLAEYVVKEPKRNVHLIPTKSLLTPGTVWEKDDKNEWHEIGPDEDDDHLQLA